MSLLKGYSMIMFGGGACIIPFLNLFKSSNNVGGTSPATHHVSSPAPTVEPASPPSSPISPLPDSEPRLEAQQKSLIERDQIKELDNCQFKAEPERVTAPEFIDASSKYIYFSCDNKGQPEEILTSRWDIWIPKSFLKEPQPSLKDGQRVKIKTVSSYAEDSSGEYALGQHVTTFESNIFSVNPLKGEWGGTPVAEEDYSYDAPIYKVKITEPKLENVVLYLRWYF